MDHRRYMTLVSGIFFYTKIRFASHATKIIKNNRVLFLRQFSSIRCQLLSIHEYIWCCCHITFRHRQINVQNIAANVWHCGSFLSISLALILRLRAAPNRLQCSSNYFRCSSNHSPNLSPFGRTYDVLPNRPSVLTRATSYRSCICFASASKHSLTLSGWYTRVPVRRSRLISQVRFWRLCQRQKH